MNAELKTVGASNALTVVERAALALNSSEHEKNLIAMAERAKGITTITNAAGYKELHATRIVLKTERLTIEREGKEARDDAQKFSKAVIAEERRLIAIIEPEEARLKQMQDAHDAKVAAEKEAKRKAEEDRLARIRGMIEEITGTGRLLTATSAPADIEGAVAELKAMLVDETFQEFQELAAQAKSKRLGELTSILAAAVAHEIETRAIEARREELRKAEEAEAQRKREAEERERQEQAKRDAAARDNQAATRFVENLVEPPPPAGAITRKIIAREPANNITVDDTSAAPEIKVGDTVTGHPAGPLVVAGVEASPHVDDNIGAARSVARESLDNWRVQFGDMPEFVRVATAIDDYFEAMPK